MFFQVESDVQLSIVAGSALLGIAMGAFYDLFRIFRLIFFKGWLSSAVQDVLFWTVCGYATFLHTLALNRGEVRLYILLSILAGFLLYYYTIGKVIFTVVSHISNAVKKMLAKCAGFIVGNGKKLFRKIVSSLNKEGRGKKIFKRKEKALEIDERDIV